jgi:hypothetical protein
MDVVSTDEDPAVSDPTQSTQRICVECGEPFQPRRRGRPSRYCRPACRQRAWALRQAEAALLEEGALAPAVWPTPPASTTPTAPASTTPTAAPTDARGWLGLLNELAAQLSDPESDLVRRPWEHVRVYDGLGRALAALDTATPGGLEWLDRHD